MPTRSCPPCLLRNLRQDQWKLVSIDPGTLPLCTGHKINHFKLRFSVTFIHHIHVVPKYFHHRGSCTPLPRSLILIFVSMDTPTLFIYTKGIIIQHGVCCVRSLVISITCLRSTLVVGSVFLFMSEQWYIVPKCYTMHFKTPRMDDGYFSSC